MRKKSIVFICLTLFMVAATKGASARGLFDIPKAPKFSITSGTLNVNGTKFEKNWKINSFLTAVGGDYTTKTLYHKVHTFDDLGVHVYEYQATQEANEIQISFVKQKMKFAPKTSFQGSFKVEKFTITRKTSIDKVMKNLPDYNFTKKTGNSYRGEYKGVYIYLNYNLKSQIDYISFGTVGRD